MKRILTLLAAVTMLMAGLSAQTRALATLSHEGQLTFFDKVSAFEDAVEAAVDGDTIYLSEGKFAASKQLFRIERKKISIIGCGYKSHITSDIQFRLSEENHDLTAPLFDGVRLESLSLVSRGDYLIDNVEIKKCYIEKLPEIGSYADNIILDRCYVKNYSNYSSGRNIHIINSKINEFKGYSCEIVENCNIESVSSPPSYMLNSVIENISLSGMYDFICENSLMGSLTLSGTNMDSRNCYDAPDADNLLDDNLECTIEDMSSYVGTDGTVVGIYGGQWFPYSETPSVPAVDSAKSSVEYDPGSNKLNVTITVTAN